MYMLYACIAFLQLKFATSSADVNLHFLTDYVTTAVYKFYNILYFSKYPYI